MFIALPLIAILLFVLCQLGQSLVIIILLTAAVIYQN